MIPIIIGALAMGARVAAGAAAGEAATSGSTALKIGGNVARQVSMHQKSGSGGSEPRSQNFSKGSGGGDVYGAFSN